MPDEPQGSPPPGGWLPPENPEGPAPGGGQPGGGPPGGAQPGGPPPGGPPPGGQPPPQPPPPQQPQQGQPSPQQGQTSPYGPQWGGAGYQQQPPAWGQPQQPYGQQPYGQQWGQPYGQPTPYASTYYWHQAEPDNGPAIAGFIMALASLGTLVLFFGVLSPINFCVSLASVFVSRNGIRKVDEGETTKNADLAKWGFWLGVIGTLLSALVIAGFIALVTSGAFDAEPR